jgi:hypothetical protein
MRIALAVLTAYFGVIGGGGIAGGVIGLCRYRGGLLELDWIAVILFGILLLSTAAGFAHSNWRSHTG